MKKHITVTADSKKELKKKILKKMGKGYVPYGSIEDDGVVSYFPQGEGMFFEEMYSQEMIYLGGR